MANPASARDYRLENAGQLGTTKQGRGNPIITKTPDVDAELDIARTIVARGVGADISDLDIKEGGNNETLLGWAIDDRGLSSVDNRLLEEAENILTASDNGGLVEQQGPSLASTINDSLLFTSPIMPGLGNPAVTGAVAGGLGGLANEGNPLDALVGAALGFAGGSLGGAVDSGPLTSLSEGIYNAGQGAMDFIGGLLPGNELSLPDPLSGLDTTFTPPDYGSFENLNFGSVGLDDALQDFLSPAGIGLPTIPSGNVVSDPLADLEFEPPSYEIPEDFELTATPPPSFLEGLEEVFDPSILGLGAVVGSSPEAPRGPLFAPGTFTEQNHPNAMPNYGSKGAYELPESEYNRASPFRKSLLQNAINTGRLVLT